MATSIQLLLNGKSYDCQPGETVLDALLRQHVQIPYSCRNQVCMSCIMRSLNGMPPLDAQINLKETLRSQNNFLACGCYPDRNMEIALPKENLQYQVKAKVLRITRLNPHIIELLVQCDTPLDYHAGQSVLVMNTDLIGKRLPIATPSSIKGEGRYEIHVERIEGGFFSEWVHEHLKVGDQLMLSGVEGELFYLPGKPNKPLLLVGWNAGQGALTGILEDAFENQHIGPVYLFHQVSHYDYLYFVDEIMEIGEYYANFHYLPCIEQGLIPDGYYRGLVQDIIKTILPKLNNWAVYLCGPRLAVQQMQRHAYLAGANMKEIYREITEI